MIAHIPAHPSATARRRAPRLAAIAQAVTSDAHLLDAIARRRAADAFETLYRRHFTAVARATERRCNDATLADEAAQDAFLRLWNNAALMDPHATRLRPWLVTVAYHVAMDRMRRKRLANAPLGEAYALASSDPSPSETVLGRETSAEIRAALAQLPVAQRRALELSYFAGLSQSEVAERLGEPLGTIKSRCRLGLERLRRMLATGAQRALAGSRTRGSLELA